MKIPVKIIKQLRGKTGAGLLDVRQALDKAKGEVRQAEVILKKKGLEKAAKRAERQAKEGFVFTYVHQGRVGAMVKLNCETDFVARSHDFQTLGKELAMQVASMNPKSVKKLLAQDYIRDSKMKVEALVKDTAVRVKEHVVVAEIAYLKL